jgi:glutaminase
MQMPRDIERKPRDAYVSTGRLPPPDMVQALVREAYERFRGMRVRVGAEFAHHSISRLLQSYDRLCCDSAEAVDLCTRQCSLRVRARDLG